MTDRHACRPFPNSGVAQAAVDEACRYRELDDQIAHIMGAINVAVGQLVLVAKAALDEDLANGYGIASPADWLAWRTGLAKQQCNSILALASRAEELPSALTAVVAGDLTLDQAAQIARHVPAAHEQAATEFAKTATVAQLRRNLSRFGFEKPEPKAKPEPGRDDQPEPVTAEVHRGRDDRSWHLAARLPDDEAAVFDTALEAIREDLYQQRKLDAHEGATVAQVTLSEALVAMAETALAARSASVPGSDRYLVHLHLQAGTSGPVLANHLGMALPESVRRMLLCDCQMRATTWDRLNPLNVGRLTRSISRRMRRAIEHRDGGCAAPGCNRTTGLHIHHIVHWEDGGPTDTENLLTLCNTHHRLHHEGQLGIARTADTHPGQPGWITFTDRTGRKLDPCGIPIPKHRPSRPGIPAGTRPPGPGPDHDPHHDPLQTGTPASEAHQAAQAAGLSPIRYQCPSGEPVNPKWLTLHPEPPPRSSAA